MSVSVSSVENLKVFQDSHKLTLELYQLTKKFPNDEKFGLVSQIRRASSSICANLIEGSHRNNKNEYRQFVGIARGSIGELKYHLLLSKDLGYIDLKQYDIIINKINEISKMLYGLIKSLEKAHTHTHNSHSKNSKGVF
jgi:four helix bundle protein